MKTFDYELGRFAWLLTDKVKLDRLIPTCGSLGL